MVFGLIECAIAAPGNVRLGLPVSDGRYSVSRKSEGEHNQICHGTLSADTAAQTGQISGNIFMSRLWNGLTFRISKNNCGALTTLGGRTRQRNE